MKRTLSDFKQALTHRRRYERRLYNANVLNVNSYANADADVNNVNADMGVDAGVIVDDDDVNNINADMGVGIIMDGSESLGDLDLLCTDNIIQILKYLDINTLLITMQVCKKLYRCIVDLKLLTITKFEKTAFYAPEYGVPNAIETLANHHNKEALFIRGLVYFINDSIIESCKDFNIYFNWYSGTPYFHTDGVCVLDANIVNYNNDVYYTISYVHRLECYHLRIVIYAEDGYVFEPDKELIWLCCKNLAKFDSQITQDNITLADSTSCASFRRDLPGECSIKLRNTNIILDAIRMLADDFYLNIFIIDDNNSDDRGSSWYFAASHSSEHYTYIEDNSADSYEISNSSENEYYDVSGNNTNSD